MSRPLGIRVAASLAKQYESIEDNEFDDYDFDDDVGNEPLDVERNDGVDHLLNDDIDNNDNVYDDYDDVNDLSEHDNGENDDGAFTDNDYDHHNEAIEENYIEDDFSDDDTYRIPGYRPDIALTTTLPYYN